MQKEILSQRGTVMTRRLILEPGEAMWWHTDLCTRYSVVVRGDRLGIEDQETGKISEFPVYPGMADWDEPQPRVHRGINVGNQTFEEVVVFFLNEPEMDPQPEPS